MSDIITLEEPLPEGAEIEVWIRYGGKEFRLSHGVIETVHVDREMEAHRVYGGGLVTLPPTRETLTIVVRR